MSNACKLQRLFAFYEATSKPRTGIHRHRHHQYHDATSDSCAQPTEDAVPNRIRTTSNMHLPIPSSDPLHQISLVTHGSGGEPILTTNRCTHSG